MSPLIGTRGLLVGTPPSKVSLRLFTGSGDPERDPEGGPAPDGTVRHPMEAPTPWKPRPTVTSRRERAQSGHGGGSGGRTARR